MTIFAAGIRSRSRPAGGRETLPRHWRHLRRRSFVRPSARRNAVVRTGTARNVPLSGHVSERAERSDAGAVSDEVANDGGEL